MARCVAGGVDDGHAWHNLVSRFHPHEAAFDCEEIALCSLREGMECGWPAGFERLVSPEVPLGLADVVFRVWIENRAFRCHGRAGMVRMGMGKDDLGDRLGRNARRPEIIGQAARAVLEVNSGIVVDG